MDNHFDFYREIVIDGNQKLVIESSRVNAYFTTVSVNALTGAPIVIGPSQLPATNG